MKLYLDCCCYNRPYDDLSQHRVAVESACIKTILNSSNYIFGSDLGGMIMVDIKNKDELRRVGMEALKNALGPVGAMEFLGLFDYNHGDYTKEKYETAELSMEEILTGIETMKETNQVV